MARWIRRSHLFRRDEYICSRCGAVCDQPLAFCPNCDAQMKRVKADAGWVDEAEELSAFLDEDW